MSSVKDKIKRIYKDLDSLSKIVAQLIAITSILNRKGFITNAEVVEELKRLTNDGKINPPK